MVRPKSAPRLVEWVTATEAAEIFGVSRQTVNQMIRAGEFESLHVLGPPNKVQYVLARKEVERIRKNRMFPRATPKGGRR